MTRRLLIVLVLLLTALPLNAQQEPANPPGDNTDTTNIDVEAVPYDDVNEVAARMYCPICEMEPLHTCRAQTCIDWREVIRERLARGETEDEIIDYFVTTYGDRVVGIPEDEGLRLFSLAGPIIMFFVALGVAFMTFQRWQQSNDLVSEGAPSTEVLAGNSTSNNDADDDYRKRLESDLQS